MARILAIDDDTQVRILIRVALEALGHTVQEAPNGHEGLRLFAQQPADLVMCDLFMPEKEGLETIRDLRRQFPDVKIIAMSGFMPKYTRTFLRIAQELGALKALEKPFDIKTLVAAVKEVLESPNEVNSTAD